VKAWIGVWNAHYLATTGYIAKHASHWLTSRFGANHFVQKRAAPHFQCKSSYTDDSVIFFINMLTKIYKHPSENCNFRPKGQVWWCRLSSAMQGVSQAGLKPNVLYYRFDTPENKHRGRSCGADTCVFPNTKAIIMVTTMKTTAISFERLAQLTSTHSMQPCLSPLKRYHCAQKYVLQYQSSRKRYLPVNTVGFSVGETILEDMAKSRRSCHPPQLQFKATKSMPWWLNKPFCR